MIDLVQRELGWQPIVPPEQGFSPLPRTAELGPCLNQAVTDLEDRLRVLDALCIPTRYPDSLPEGAPTDHFGRLQSQDALSHARALLDAIRAALAIT